MSGSQEPELESLRSMCMAPGMIPAFCCDITHQIMKPHSPSNWDHLQPPSASAFEYFSQAGYEQTVIFLSYNSTAMKLGIFRRRFHPEEKRLLRKWNTSCMNPNQEMKEREQGDSKWLEESFVATTSEHSQACIKGKNVGCQGVTMQVIESKVTALGQERKASALNMHPSFPRRSLTCKTISDK